VRGWIRITLVAGVVVLFGGTFAVLWSLKLIGYDRLGGQPTFQVEGVAGPDSGPVCPVDKRYVDEQPAGLRDDVLPQFTSLKAKAAAEKITLCLQDGKRSTRQQQAQFDEYVTKFGSYEQARKYALPPAESMHVKGVAIDIQPLASAAWIEQSAGKYGWCRRYENEPWHFEYNPEYVKGCPALQPHA
jgi:D-alanyl-D-alanine carboxypeptidase